MRLAVIPPRCHDRNILDITMNLYTYPTIIIAHRLGVFEFMSKSPRNINDISTELQIKKRPAEAIMATLRALNLVELNAGLFRLTSEAQEFLLKGSPNYFGYFWDMMYENSENFSLKIWNQPSGRIRPKFIANALFSIRMLMIPRKRANSPTPCIA